MPRMHWHREQIRSEQTSKQSVLIVGSQSLVYIATLRVIHQYCACAQLDSTAIFTTRRDRKGIQPVKKTSGVLAWLSGYKCAPVSVTSLEFYRNG